MANSKPYDLFNELYFQILPQFLAQVPLNEYNKFIFLYVLMLCHFSKSKKREIRIDYKKMIYLLRKNISFSFARIYKIKI